MLDKMRSARRTIDSEIAGANQRKYLSPAFYGQFLAVRRAFQRYLFGAVMDLGCGVMPYRELLPERVTLYHGLDRFPLSDEVSLVGDIQNLAMISSESYDSVVCLEVLEHVPEPAAALAEIARILRPGGILVLSVPHLSRLHEVPLDFYRYTEYGLRHLLNKYGLEVIEIQDRGGLFTFLGHQASTFLLGVVWNNRWLRSIACLLNRWLFTLPATLADRGGPQRSLFPIGYVAVARKPGREQLT